jgi:hypothetical protein
MLSMTLVQVNYIYMQKYTEAENRTETVRNQNIIAKANSELSISFYNVSCNCLGFTAELPFYPYVV